MNTDAFEFIECLSPDPYKVLGRQIRRLWDEQEEALRKVQETHYVIPKRKEL